MGLAAELEAIRTVTGRLRAVAGNLARAVDVIDGQVEILEGELEGRMSAGSSRPSGRVQQGAAASGGKPGMRTCQRCGESKGCRAFQAGHGVCRVCEDAGEAAGSAEPILARGLGPGKGRRVCEACEEAKGIKCFEKGEPICRKCQDEGREPKREDDEFPPTLGDEDEGEDEDSGASSPTARLGGVKLCRRCKRNKPAVEFEGGKLFCAACREAISGKK